MATQDSARAVRELMERGRGALAEVGEADGFFLVIEMGLPVIPSRAVLGEVFTRCLVDGLAVMFVHLGIPVIKNLGNGRPFGIDGSE